jgi:hypothetical protein
MTREERAARLRISVAQFAEVSAVAMKIGKSVAPPRRSRSSPTRAAKKPQRGTVQDAVSILGKEARTVRAMAGRGEIPGAAKIGGTWTFNLDRLRDYVTSKEREIWQSARPQRAVSGATTSSMVGYKPAAKISNGHYEQTIQQLRKLAARQSEPVQ